jgi:hypothetical protein
MASAVGANGSSARSSNLLDFSRVAASLQFEPRETVQGADAARNLRAKIAIR